MGPYGNARLGDSGLACAGVWVDEFEAMGLGDCMDHVWQRAEVFLDSSESGKK